MPRTIDGDSDRLGEDEAILTNEDGNLVEGIGLGELGGRLRRIGLDLLELETVGLRNGADGRGAGVTLSRQSILARCYSPENWHQKVQNMAYSVGVELSEWHLA